jgi:FlaA1/EpsC-like NDP-sugar epimerase
MSSSSNRLQQIAGHIRGEQPTDATRYTTSLEGKVCIVTGAGSPMGIGRAACWAFAHNHAAVVYLTDISGDLAAAAAEIQKTCPKTKVIGKGFITFC